MPVMMLLHMSILQANNHLPAKSITADPVATNSSTLSNVFFDDVNFSSLFIDFAALNDQIVSVKIIKDDQILLSDDVTDLPGDVIYEINTTVLRPGDYLVEIETNQKIKIQKNLRVE